MPAFVKTAKDEERWARAKQIVEDEYELTEADGERFWKLVNGIYQRMGKIKKALAFLRKGTVKGYYRKNPKTGQKEYVKPHATKVTKKSEEGPAPKAEPVGQQQPQDWQSGKFSITVSGNRVRLKSPFSEELIARIKKVKKKTGAAWDRATRTWVFRAEAYDVVRSLVEAHIAAEQGARVAEAEAPAEKWESGQYSITPRETTIEVRSPYSGKLVAELRAIDRAHWNADRKCWVFDKSAYDTVKAVLDRYARWPAKPEPQAPPKPEHEAAPKTSITLHRGEGNGARPYRVGDVIRTREGQIVAVVAASQKYFRDDGLSFGVGADEGYLYQAACRPVTEQEAHDWNVAHEARTEAETTRKLAAVKRREIERQIREEGERPEGTDNRPDGEMIGGEPDIYGGGEWFVIGPEHIWYVRNNGMDGDNWELNNVRTGGAGAIGWRIPYSKELADEVRRVAEIASMKKSVLAILRKGRVKGHPRKLKSGKVAQIPDYTTRKTKKPKAQTPATDKRTRRKYKQCAKLARVLPTIDKTIAKDLGRRDTPRRKTLAAAAYLIRHLNLRVGSERYATEHETYGVASLLKSHLQIEGDTITLRFTGKKGIQWEKQCSDPALAKFLTSLEAGAPGERLFWYRANGAKHDVNENDIRHYLDRFGVSPKDFRTYNANVRMFDELHGRNLPEGATKTEINRNIAEALETVAAELVHSPSVCRSSYIFAPLILDYKEHGGRLSVRKPLSAGAIAKALKPGTNVLPDITEIEGGFVGWLSAWQRGRLARLAKAPVPIVLRKAHVKAHQRKTKSGKVLAVRAYETKRVKVGKFDVLGGIAPPPKPLKNWRDALDSIVYDPPRVSVPALEDRALRDAVKERIVEVAEELTDKAGGARMFMRFVYSAVLDHIHKRFLNGLSIGLADHKDIERAWMMLEQVNTRIGAVPGLVEGILKETKDPMYRLSKGRVKPHQRRAKGGKVIAVRGYETKRTKREPEAISDKVSQPTHAEKLAKLRQLKLRMDAGTRRGFEESQRKYAPNLDHDLFVASMLVSIASYYPKTGGEPTQYRIGETVGEERPGQLALDDEPQGRVLETRFGWGNVVDGKQSWQMTQAEFAVHPHTRALLRPSGTTIYSGMGNPSRAAQRRQYSQSVENFHRLEVKDAIAAGYAVPAQVLADYPDLALGLRKAIAIDLRTPATKRIDAWLDKWMAGQVLSR